jgi:translation initiation factor 2-alpha kinase 4
MEYCESTLLEAIHKLNNVVGDTREATIWSYFAQTVQGLAHLHANGIIHRDVKPNNIFVKEGVVKIGDLGLATHHGIVRTRGATATTVTTTNESKSSEVGTYLYQAPEVLTGNYNEKCDIYSLGVLLVEIFSDFSTAMERANVLGNLKSVASGGDAGKLFSEEWSTMHRHQATLAKKLLSTNPNSRPSCTDIPAEMPHLGLWEHTTTSVIDLQSQVRQLKEKVAQKDQEIARLQKLLEANNVPHNTRDR